jgi:hypothetical protein
MIINLFKNPKDLLNRLILAEILSPPYLKQKKITPLTPLWIQRQKK